MQNERELLVVWYRDGASALIRSRAHAILMNSQGLNAHKIAGKLQDY